MTLNSAIVRGTGSYLPGQAVAFHQIESVLGELQEVTPDFQRWCRRTHNIMYQILGMENYHYAIDPATGECTETSASMAAKASRKACDMAGIHPTDVDLILWCGATPDRYICPPTSTFVQEALEIDHCAEMSIHSNCSAAFKGLQVASDFISCGRYNTVLVCSSNLISPLLRARYLNQPRLGKNQAILRWFLCDGAGAVILSKKDGPGLQLLDTYTQSVGAKYPPHLYNSLGCVTDTLLADFAQGRHHINQDYRELSQIGPRLFADGFADFVARMRARWGQPKADQLLFQASHFLMNVSTRHLIDLTVEELAAHVPEIKAAPFDLYYSAREKRGYTGPASLLITLDELVRSHSFVEGESIVGFVNESSKWINAGFVMQWNS